MKTLSSSLALLAAVASAGANAITLQFDYTYDDNGFFADATRRSILEQAGAYFGSRITDDLGSTATQRGMTRGCHAPTSWITKADCSDGCARP